MKNKLLKLLLLYFVTFGLVGMIGVLDSALHDWHNHGRFFMRTSLESFVIVFIAAPIFGLTSLIKSFANFSPFGVQWEVHLIILMFLGLAFIGFLRENKIILTIAVLMPLIWAIIDLDLMRSL